MKIIAALVGVLATLVVAHGEGEAHVPTLVGGRNFLVSLRARNGILDSQRLSHDELHKRDAVPKVPGKMEGIIPRQSDTNCGPGVGVCPTSQCCSPAGYCGNGPDYCNAPDCQLAYGPACDGNQKPSGASTASLPRPQLGQVELGGAGIYDCVTPGDVAFTFDDGPYNYTSDLLDKLLAYNAKATFFITGNNLGKGPIDSTPQWNSLIKRMVAEGHQVASHTWSHQNLTSLDSTTFSNQLIYNEMAFRNILGYWPSYMRPPYSECNSTCGALLKTLGYVETYFDLDTAGYLNDSPALIQNSKNIWDAAINSADNKTTSFLEIEHDIHYQTVYNLTDYILASMYKHGFKSVTVGECLGDPQKNWYRYGNETAVLEVSTDATCSPSTFTCLGSTFGDCCSSSGFCGNTSAYCGSGCQPGAGSCSKAISTDGTCNSLVTCIGSVYGDCCSSSGYCGNDTAYCGTGCNPLGGTCGIQSSVSSLTSSTSVTSSLGTTSSSAIGTVSVTSSFSSTSPSKTSSLPTTSSSTSKSSTLTLFTSLSTSKSSSSSSSKSSSSPSPSPESSSLSRKSSTISSTATTAVTTSAISSATPKLVKSPSGSCGGKTGYTCSGTIWGQCCGPNGKCGYNTGLRFFNPFCGAGCQNGFGTCA